MKQNLLSNPSGRCAVLALLLAGLALLPACRTVPVNGDTVAEVKFGELQVFANHDFETAYQAAKKGVADYKLFLTQDDKKYREAELKARDSVDTMIIVKIKEVARDRTSIKVRYGITGDTDNARKLYNEIEKHF